MTQEMLLEVMPTPEIKEKTIQRFFYSEEHRKLLELEGYIATDPYAKTGVAIKTIREIVV